MATNAAHHERIAACLRSLGRDPAILRYEILQGGISGATTELRTILLHWPAFLSRAPARQLKYMVWRLHRLADRLDLAG